MIVPHGACSFALNAYFTAFLSGRTFAPFGGARYPGVVIHSTYTPHLDRSLRAVTSSPFSSYHKEVLTSPPSTYRSGVPGQHPGQMVGRLLLSLGQAPVAVSGGIEACGTLSACRWSLSARDCTRCIPAVLISLAGGATDQLLGQHTPLLLRLLECAVAQALVRDAVQCLLVKSSRHTLLVAYSGGCDGLAEFNAAAKRQVHEEDRSPEGLVSRLSAQAQFERESPPTSHLTLQQSTEAE